MSVALTAESSVRVTVLPETTTPLEATWRRLLPTVTKKSSGEGARPVASRFASKVTTSVAPFTVALENDGAVALLTAWRPKVATALALASCSLGSVVGWA